MFPIVINTIPENGSENVSLETPILVYFDEELMVGGTANVSINETNIKLVNMNTNSEVEISISLGEDAKIVSIDPVGSLDGLTDYAVRISGLLSPYGEEMFGTFELKFRTEADDAADYIQDPVSGSSLEVIATYPKDMSMIGSSEIKIKFSSALAAPVDTSGIAIYEEIEGMDKEDIVLFGENLISSEDIAVSSDLITISAPASEDGKGYLVVIDGIEGAEPYSFSYYARPSSYFAETTEIRAITGIKSITSSYTDYEIINWIKENSEMAEFISTDSGYHEEIDWSNPPLFVKRYVIAKTQYDIVFGKVVELSSRPTSKQLEDLTIEYGFSLADMLKLADKLKAEYTYWEMFLKGKRPEKASPGTFIKGENADEIPEYKSRQLKGWDGTKSW